MQCVIIVLQTYTILKVLPVTVCEPNKFWRTKILQNIKLVVSTHSSCSDFNIAGMLVAVGGLGLTSGSAVQNKMH